jgi:predicted ribosome-associated RNA-binding protein Tma20
MQYKSVVLVHSDDKNEIYIINDDDLKNKFHEKIIKYNTLFPKLFSLKTSETKDSYSFKISEMVGLQNIMGDLFENANKMISGILLKLDFENYINNYNYILSRIEEYYKKSSKFLNSYMMEDICFSFLRRRYKLEDLIEELPISSGGRIKTSWRLLSLFGSASDDYLKLYLNRPLFITEKSVIKKTSKAKRNIQKRKIKELKKEVSEIEYNKFRKEELIHSTLDEEFSKILLISFKSNKQDMFLKKDHLDNLRFFILKKNLLINIHIYI